jgi:2'-5' RNA ligase
LTRVPVPWLHSTLQSIGPLSAEQAQAVAAGGRAALAGFPAFSIEIGPAHMIHNELVADLYPEEDLAAVYWALREATEKVVGPDALPARPARFWPHMSLGYSNAGSWDDDALRRSLAKDLRPARARLRVDRVVLVNQRQDWCRLYSWTVVDTIPLVGET